MVEVDGLEMNNAIFSRDEVLGGQVVTELEQLR